MKQTLARTSKTSLWALALMLGAGLAAAMALNWPGQFSPDSVWQLKQGREGVYNSWHPPVMAWLLGLFDRVTPGAGSFILFDAALGYGALFAFAALSPKPRWRTVALAGALAASPLLVIYQGDVWKDVLFANASVAGFAALAWSDRCCRRPMTGNSLAGLAFALFALAALTRQNGALIALFGAAGFGWAAWRRDRSSLRKAALHGIVGLAGCLALAGIGGYALALHSDGDPAQAEQVEWVQAWDLAGALRVDPRLDLSALAAAAPDAAALVRGAAKVWQPQRMDSLILYPGADDALDGAGPAVGRQWRRLVLGRPLLYARVRLAVFGQILATPEPMQCRPLFIGFDAPPQMLKSMQLTERHRPRDDWARAYGLAFVGSPVLSHLAYAGLAVILLGLAAKDLARPTAPSDRIAVIAMLVGSAAFAASFLVLGLACDYRYLYLVDLAAMAAFMHRAAAQPL